MIWRYGLPWLAGTIFVTLVATPVWANDPKPPPPGTANQCGRLTWVTLAPIAYTHRSPYYPLDAQRRGQQGRDFLRITVDKYGFAGQVEVVGSSGYAILDQAAIDEIKYRWRWQPPPPECQDSGVVLAAWVDWSLGEPGPKRIYLDDPHYPADARVHKRGGSGKVEYTISKDNKITDPHVVSSAGSPEMDAAMVASISATYFISDSTTSTTSTGSARFEFVPRNNPDTFAALMGPAIIPNPADRAAKQPSFTFVDPYPKPALSNDCGRGAPAFLDPNPTNLAPPFPTAAAVSGKGGRTWLDVIVDKSGTASEVSVAQTSGSQLLDTSAVQAIKGLWHWEVPPAECAEQGVHLRTYIDWFIGAVHKRVMAGDPGYPAEAVAGKLSGSGAAQITRSWDGDLESTKILTSTNSPVLDAAMIKILTDARFTPGTKELHRRWTNGAIFDFVGDPETMRAADVAPTRRNGSDLPPPSAANDCGRGAPIFLAPIENTHALVPIPILSVKISRREVRYRAQGAMQMQVVVDKDGNAASVTVAASSAPPEMERSVTEVVKGRYRWDPPPAECADRGVMLEVNYVYTDAPPKFVIYADDPDYPDAARQRPMGVPGIVQVHYHGDEVDDAKILVGTNSPELNADLVKIVSDRLLAELKIFPRKDPGQQAFPVMFLPAFVLSPGQLAAQAARAQTRAASPVQSATAP